METTTLNAATLDSNNRMLGDNYQPKTIDVQDQAFDVKTTNDIKETQFTTQGETITTNSIEESPTTVSSPDKETTGSVDMTSVDIPTTTNVEIITTAGGDIPTSVQSELTTSMNQNEDTTKENNDNSVTDQTTTIQDDSPYLETDILENTTEESDNLLLNTLLKVKGKPVNYNRMSHMTFDYDREEYEDDDDDTGTVDIKEIQELIIQSHQKHFKPKEVEVDSEIE